MQRKRLPRTDMVDADEGDRSSRFPAKRHPSYETPGQSAMKMALAVVIVFLVAIAIIAAIGHIAWLAANGWMLLVAGIVIGLAIWQWPRGHEALLESRARKSELKQAEKLAEAQAAEILAAAERTRAEARQIHYSLTPDQFGNVFYHPDQGGPSLLNSPNFNPNYGLSSFHMHNVTHAGGTTVTEEKPGRQLMLPAPKTIPLMYDLAEAFRQIDVGPDRILLGKSDHSDYITVSDNNLCHGVFNAITGKGKSVVERGIASQLIHAGHLVTWLDLKFALMTEEGLDYRPLAKKLWNQPPMRVTINGMVYEVPHILRNEGDIAAVLHWIAYDEIERRLCMRDAGDFSFPTHFFFLEEMLAFIKQHPEAAEDVVRIIALGRELRIKLFTAAQNFLAKDTKLTGGAKENFETAYFLGGDTFSGSKVLDVTQKDLNEYLARYNVELGKGLTLLRNNTVAPQATLARVGMASNEPIYYHHGRADSFQLPQRTEVYTPMGGSIVDADVSPERITGPLQPIRRTSSALPPQLQAALDAYQRGFTTSRTLASELNVGKTRGAELIQEMKARRLIQ